ncbi:TPA: hypothetical protein ACH3X2_012210 [Trebouxia sp. C0005]
MFRQRQENIAPEVQTPSVLKEHVFKSHPLDMDSDSEVSFCDCQASYTSSLDHQADRSTSPGKQDWQEPSASAQSTASKLSQQVSSQRADFIASHTPTSLNKAHKIAGSMQSLAREAALAAANRAENVSTSIEAAADMERDQSSSATQQNSGTGVQDKQQSVKQTSNDAHVETKSDSAGLFDWALSTLYFLAGLAVAVREGTSVLGPVLTHPMEQACM